MTDPAFWLRFLYVCAGMTGWIGMVIILVVVFDHRERRHEEKDSQRFRHSRTQAT